MGKLVLSLQSFVQKTSSRNGSQFIFQFRNWFQVYLSDDQVELFFHQLLPFRLLKETTRNQLTYLGPHVINSLWNFFIPQGRFLPLSVCLISFESGLLSLIYRIGLYEFTFSTDAKSNQNKRMLSSKVCYVFTNLI